MSTFYERGEVLPHAVIVGGRLTPQWRLERVGEKAIELGLASDVETFTLAQATGYRSSKYQKSVRDSRLITHGSGFWAIPENTKIESVAMVAPSEPIKLKTLFGLASNFLLKSSFCVDNLDRGHEFGDVFVDLFALGHASAVNLLTRHTLQAENVGYFPMEDEWIGAPPAYLSGWLSGSLVSLLDVGEAGVTTARLQGSHNELLSAPVEALTAIAKQPLSYSYGEKIEHLRSLSVPN